MRLKKSRLYGSMAVVLLSLGLFGCGDKAMEESENTESVNVEVANPWTDSDEQGVLEATGFDLVAPEGSSNVLYSYMDESKMAQMTFEKDNTLWVYRIKATEALEDISGMNYEWIYEDQGMVSGRNAVFYGYSDATEETEYIDSVYAVQVVNWFDDVTGVSYSLSASGTDINGMDIQVYAEEIYVPLQGEADGDV